MARLVVDDDWHHVVVVEVLGSGRLVVEIVNGQIGAGMKVLLDLESCSSFCCLALTRRALAARDRRFRVPRRMGP
jgi:hypothetical protein